MRSAVVPHGASDPEPEPNGAGQSGPGQWRIFAPTSKYVPADPLKHGQGGDASQGSFAFGPRSNAREGGEFRTLDVSRYNEKVHNWQRIDTFQTPAGHLGDRPIQPDIEEVPSQCSFRPEYLEALRRNIRDDMRSEMHEVAALLLQIRKEVLQVAAEVQRVEQSVNSAELLAEVRRLRAEVDLSPVLDGLRRGEAESARMLEEIQKLKGEIDFSLVLEELRRLQDLRRARPQVDFSVVLDAVHDAQATLSAELRKAKSDAVNEGIRRFKTEVEPRPVQASVDFAPLVEEIRQMKSNLPFERVFEEITKSKTDLQPVLARAARIVEEVRKGKDEVLQQMSRGAAFAERKQESRPEPQFMARPDKRDFQLEVVEEGHMQRVDFSMRGGEMLHIPVSPRTAQWMR